MRCRICGGEVPRERVEFLFSEGREVVCITCQKRLEEEGNYRTYRGVIVTDAKVGYYDFVPTRVELPVDPFRTYRGLRKFFSGAE